MLDSITADITALSNHWLNSTCFTREGQTATESYFLQINSSMISREETTGLRACWCGFFCNYWLPNWLFFLLDLDPLSICSIIITIIIILIKITIIIIIIYFFFLFLYLLVIVVSCMLYLKMWFAKVIAPIRYWHKHRVLEQIWHNKNDVNCIDWLRCLSAGDIFLNSVSCWGFSSFCIKKKPWV